MMQTNDSPQLGSVQRQSSARSRHYKSNRTASEVLQSESLDELFGNFTFSPSQQLLFYELVRSMRMCWRLLALAAASDALHLGTWAAGLTPEVARAGVSYSTLASVLHDSVLAFLVYCAAGGFEALLASDGNQMPQLMQGIMLLANFFLQIALFSGSIAVLQVVEAALAWPGIKVVLFAALCAAVAARSLAVGYTYSRFRHNMFEGAARVWDRRHSRPSGSPSTSPSASPAAAAAAVDAGDGGGDRCRQGRPASPAPMSRRSRVGSIMEQLSLSLSGSFLLPRGLPEAAGGSSGASAAAAAPQTMGTGSAGAAAAAAAAAGVGGGSAIASGGRKAQDGEGGKAQRAEEDKGHTDEDEEFEFTPWDEQILLATVQAMRIAATMHAMQVVSTSLFVVASLVGRRSFAAVPVAMEVSSNSVVAVTLWNAAIAFEQIVTTEGADVRNMMHGLSLLRTLFERIASSGLSLSGLQTLRVVSTLLKGATPYVSGPVAVIGAALGCGAALAWFDRRRVVETRAALEQAMADVRARIRSEREKRRIRGGQGKDKAA